MKFVVTRQDYSSMGKKALVVEKAQGGLDYCNPGALAQRYPGEFEEFSCLTEAVEAAIKIAESWKWDTDKKINIAVGCTHGCTIPFETEPAEEETYERLRKQAAEFDANLPRCHQCGDILGDDTLEDEDGVKFCSEFCFERYHDDDTPEDEEEE